MDGFFQHRESYSVFSAAKVASSVIITGKKIICRKKATYNYKSQFLQNIFIHWNVTLKTHQLPKLI